MNSNTSNSSYELDLCSSSANLCNYIYWEILIIGASIVSIVVNILHLVVLSRGKLIKGTAYLKILQAISVDDIFVSITYALRSLCPLRLYTMTDRVFATGLSYACMFMDYRYGLLAAACTERLIALAMPYSYSTNLFIKKLPLWLSVLFTVIASKSIIKDTLFNDGLCMAITSGPSNYMSPYAGKIAHVVKISASIVIIALLVAVYIQLKKMRSHNKLSNEEQQVVRATRFIYIITLVFFVCLMPFVVVQIVDINTKDAIAASHLTSFAILVNTCYGIVNTLIYGFMYQSYRQELKGLFCKVTSPAKGIEIK